MAVYEFPTSFGQRRMWLLAEMDPGEPTYNISWALWLDGALDVGALQQAWDAALARHETLRTTFRTESGMPVQVIEDEPGGAALAGHLRRAAGPKRAGGGRSGPPPPPGPRTVRSGRRAARARRPRTAVAGNSCARAGDAPHRRGRLVVPYSVRRAVGGLRGDQLAATTPSSPIRRYSTPTSPSGRSSTPRTAGTRPARRFWQAELANAPSALPLPTRRAVWDPPDVRGRDHPGNVRHRRWPPRSGG